MAVWELQIEQVRLMFDKGSLNTSEEGGSSISYF